MVDDGGAAVDRRDAIWRQFIADVALKLTRAVMEEGLRADDAMTVLLGVRGRTHAR